MAALRYFLLGWLLLLSAAQCPAQECLHANDPPNRYATDRRFESNADGTVIDRLTKVIWMRCAVGQKWDATSDTCAGEPQALTWPQASQAASGWRLPTIHELSAITELDCFDPAIDLSVFPGTPASHFWTATAFARLPEYYWLLQFYSGENHTDVATRLAFARLVKDLEPSGR